MWHFPVLGIQSGIPINYHPGAFAFKRKYEFHTGVDLYCKKESTVFACEDSVIVGIEPFTGPNDNSPWWNNTFCILAEGESGIICYGEINPWLDTGIKIGTKLTAGDPIGEVIPVLNEDKIRSDIPGHTNYMLHLELYKKGRNKASTAWKLNEKKPEYLLDPTPYLIHSLTRLIVDLEALRSRNSEQNFRLNRNQVILPQWDGQVKRD